MLFPSDLRVPHGQKPPVAGAVSTVPTGPATAAPASAAVPMIVFTILFVIV